MISVLDRSHSASPSRPGRSALEPQPRSEGGSGPRRRILYIEANEDGSVGGSHQALFDLVRTLDRSRFEPVVLFYQDNPFVQRLRVLGIETHVYEEVRARERAIFRSRGPLRKLGEMFASVLRRCRFLRRMRIELIHINNSPKMGNDDWLPAARLLRIPCIANVMGDARGATGRVRRWLFRQFDHYLPISDYISTAMQRHGIRPERMDLIYLGVDLDAFQARVRRSRREVRAELGVPEEKVLALMVGNVREWKGQHVVLAALERMRPEDRSRLHVAFAGAVTVHDEEYRRHLVETIARAGLEEHVSFLGARQDVPDLIHAADISLHASVRPEPFGLVVVEAMALGNPVVAANTGGPAEVLTPDSGITYDPQVPEELATILAELLRDPARRRALGVGALERAKSFTVRQYVEGVERVYARILEGAALPR